MNSKTNSESYTDAMRLLLYFFKCFPIVFLIMLVVYTVRDYTDSSFVNVKSVELYDHEFYTENGYDVELSENYYGEVILITKIIDIKRLAQEALFFALALSLVFSIQKLFRYRKRVVDSES